MIVRDSVRCAAVITALPVRCHFALLVALLGHGLFGQSAGTFRIDAGEVVVDFVVRDKHRRLVRDLTQEEVAISDQGIPQRLRSLRFVQSHTSAPAAASADPVILAIVCLGLDVGERQNARSLLHGLVKRGLPPGMLAGVFLMHRRLQPVGGFTSDRDLLLRAIDQAAMQDVRAKSGDPAIENDPAAAPTSAQPGQRSDSDLDTVKRKAQKLEQVVLNHVVGLSELDGLREIVRAMAGLEGRKSILLVSQGLQLPDDHGQWLNGIIAESNRTNATFYALDPSGLRTVNLRDSFVRREETSMIYSDRFDWTLQTLSESTGGFVMRDSNDLEAPLQRMVQEAVSHYEATYSPADLKWDGRFHRVSLTVNRPKVTLQSRSGYFALPIIAGRLLMNWELPAIRAIDAASPVSDLRFQTVPPVLVKSGGSSLVEFALRIPAEQFRVVMDQKQQVALDVAAIVLIRSASGEIVERLSRREQPGGPAGAADMLTIPFRCWLERGNYRIDYAVTDLASGRAGVQSASVSVD